MSELVVDDVRKTWPGFGLFLGFSSGGAEYLCILGHSGSGKSTVLRIISGLLAPDSGRVLIDGTDVTGLPPERRGVGFLFQDLALFPHLDVAGNVGYGLRLRGVRGTELKRAVEENLEAVSLPGYAKRPIATLSGGERQRVALARTLSVKPRLVLLDEAYSSLDPPLRRKLRQETHAALSARGILAVSVTHDGEEALDVADRVIILDSGRIAASGKPMELASGPNSTPLSRDYLPLSSLPS